jgi:two-component system chemotaxis sensor kinase CheA
LGLAASDAGADADARIVVVSVSGQGRDAAEPTGAPEVAALEVDSPGERIDVMLKPMDGLLASVNGFAGTALLGDGRVLIVLDLEALLR